MTWRQYCCPCRPVRFQDVCLHTTPQSKCGWISTRADCLTPSPTGEAGAGSNLCSKRHPGNPAPFKASSHCLPTGEPWLGQATWYHHRICLKVWKESSWQRGSGRKARLQTEDIPLPLSASQTQHESLFLLVTPTYNTISSHRLRSRLSRYLGKSDFKQFNAEHQLCNVWESQPSAFGKRYIS